MAPRTRAQAWHASLSLDLIMLVLQNSIFHPFVASLIPVCLLATETPYSAPAFRNTVVYACFISLIWIIAPINERLAYGRPRKVSPDDEVVVITGGAGGLGRCLAEIYAMQGTSVAILDVQKPSRNDDIDGILEGVEYHVCDVSNTEAVAKAWNQIEDSLGTPTVLINNAGVVNKGLLSSLTNERVDETFRINATSHFNLSRMFVKGLMEQKKSGTLVTVSSVLGRLGAARLSLYTASKAALIAYHNSLTAELYEHRDSIKTILVAPGQLSTEMFSDIKQTASQRFFGPVVEVQELALKIVQMVKEGRGGQIAEPVYARWIHILDLVPVGLAKLLRDLAGVDTAVS